MARLLIVDDDPATREQLAHLLRLHGHDLLEAADGAQALALVRSAPVDLVVSDIAMPVLDGFGLVQAIRREPAVAATPVLLLTALDDRASMRRAIQVRADDYLAKPVRPPELLDAIAALLARRRRAVASESAVRERVAALSRQFAAAAALRLPRDEYGLSAGEDATAERQVDATVLFADIRNFTALAEQLGSAEVAELLARYFELACRPVLGSGGNHLKFIGDGLMSVFIDQGDELPAARRALAAALGIALAAHEFRDWADRRFAGRPLPPFAIGVGVHAGEVTQCRLGAGPSSDVTVIGDAVNVAARLESASKELGWTVVASRAVLDRAGAGVQTGGAASVALRGRTGPVEVIEVTGLLTTRDEQLQGWPALDGGRMRTAVEVNSALAAEAPEGGPVTVVPRARQRPQGD